jgi:hypothetical protein
MATPESASSSVYRIKITLGDLNPSVWRCVEIEECSLELLHLVIQDAMGWHNYHLYEFRIDGQAYSNPVTLEDDQQSAAKVTVGELAAKQQMQFQYIYDFRANWEHTVEIEQVSPHDDGTHYPRVVAGERACPPEDCGGINRFAKYLQAWDDPDHPSYEDAWDILGGKFDPAAFDAEAVTERWKTWDFADPDSGPTFEEEPEPEPEPVRRGDSGKSAAKTDRQPQVGRNDPCPCGSGKKYKKCCLKKGKDDFDEE